MASKALIPRFLLPRSGLIWRGANLGPQVRKTDMLIVRHASGVVKNAKGKPIVLEKPEKFNPPSHGARLPKQNRPQQQHYGGGLSADEAAAQKRREYPGMPPPEGTWAHWFWGSRWLHLCITSGTLLSLAIYTYTENFKANSPFADMLPSTSDFWQHPIMATRTMYEVWHLTTLHDATAIKEKRKKNVDDLSKRYEYRKAHGIEGVWSVKGEPEPPEPAKRERLLGIF